MEQLQFTNINNIRNTNFNSKTNSQTKTANAQSNESKTVTPEAASSLKAQVLYKKQDDKVEYLQDGLNRKQIIKILKNKNKMNRSFFGYKARVANIITKANDISLATANFNYIMNAKNKKLEASDVADILQVVTSINNKKMSEEMQEKYGFYGGNLNEENIDTILNEIEKQQQEQQQILCASVTQQEMLNQQMQQQMMTQAFGF